MISNTDDLKVALQDLTSEEFENLRENFDGVNPFDVIEQYEFLVECLKPDRGSTEIVSKNDMEYRRYNGE